MRVLIVLLGLIAIASAQTEKKGDDTKKGEKSEGETPLAVARECAAVRSCRGMGEEFCCPNAEGVNYGCCYEEQHHYHLLDHDSHGILPASGLPYHASDHKPKTVHEAVSNMIHNVKNSNPWDHIHDNWSAWSVPGQKTVHEAVDNILHNIHNSNPHSDWSGWTPDQIAMNNHVNSLARAAIHGHSVLDSDHHAHAAATDVHGHVDLHAAATNMIYNVHNAMDGPSAVVTDHDSPIHHHDAHVEGSSAKILPHNPVAPVHQTDAWLDHFHHVIANKPNPPPEACCKRFWGCRKNDEEFCCPNKEGIWMECCNEPVEPHIALHEDWKQPPSIIPIASREFHPSRECSRYPGCAKNGEHLCCPNREGVMMGCCHEPKHLHDALKADLYHTGPSIVYGEADDVQVGETRIAAVLHKTHNGLYVFVMFSLLGALYLYIRHRTKGDNVYTVMDAETSNDQL